MKLEQNMYVKTKKGIAKLLSQRGEEAYGYPNAWETDTFLELNDTTEYVYEEDILKASHNIIDLIEVGDYVNGYKVINTGIEEEGYRYIDLDFNKDYDELHWGEHGSLQNEDIKSIVTKEQFDSMKYEVE